jgi:hypothetical protein
MSDLLELVGSAAGKGSVPRPVRANSRDRLGAGSRANSPSVPCRLRSKWAARQRFEERRVVEGSILGSNLREVMSSSALPPQPPPENGPAPLLPPHLAPPMTITPFLHKRRRTWAKLIHRTWLSDPELCPVCGARHPLDFRVKPLT